MLVLVRTSPVRGLEQSFQSIIGSTGVLRTKIEWVRRDELGSAVGSPHIVTDRHVMVENIETFDRQQRFAAANHSQEVHLVGWDARVVERQAPVFDRKKRQARRSGGPNGKRARN